MAVAKLTYYSTRTREYQSFFVATGPKTVPDTVYLTPFTRLYPFTRSRVIAPDAADN
jgi:hypothetical protein